MPQPITKSHTLLRGQNHLVSAQSSKCLWEAQGNLLEVGRVFHNRSKKDSVSCHYNKSWIDLQSDSCKAQLFCSNIHLSCKCCSQYCCHQWFWVHRLCSQIGGLNHLMQGLPRISCSIIPLGYFLRFRFNHFHNCCVSQKITDTIF